MMFLKKLRAFTILLRGPDSETSLPVMMGVPTHRSRQFRFAALGIILLTVAIRLPSLLHPLPIDDEAGYSVIANEIVDGGRPYIDAVDRKPPLLFWTYAAAFKVAGEYNWMALHILSLVWTLATMAGLYVIAKQLFDRETGLIAALFYSVFQPWASFKNLAFNGEMIMNLAIVWAWAVGFRRSSLKWRPELLAAGALLCAAFLLKQPAAIAAIPLGIYLLLPSYRISRGLTRTQSVVHAAILTTGFFGSLALFAVFLQGQGILGETVYWTIVNNTIPYILWKNGILMTLAFVGACLPLLIGVATAIRVGRGLWAGKNCEQTALLGLLAASAIGTAAGARFYEHYYTQLIPPLSLLAAPYYAQLWTGRMQSPYWLLRPALTYAWLAATIVAFSISHWLGAARRVPLETGRYLLEHSAPNDRIFVWGNKPKIYLEARRRPACRYILSFPLTGYIFGEPTPGFDTRYRIVPGAWTTLEQDFEKHPPAYIVDLCSEPGAQYRVRDFPILAKLLAERYQPIARTAESVIYHRNDYRALAHNSPKTNR
jgi:4-amino-4-deoxy-L-arabinose transferase-like glycosyltransferase